MGRKLVWMGLLLGGVAAGPMGCNPSSLSYFLFRGEGKAPAEEKAFEAKSGKRDVTLAVLVNAPSSSLQTAGLERDLVAAIARAFEEQTKDKKPHVKVLDAVAAERFKARTPNWRTMSTAEIGRELGADYAMELSINEFQLYEPDTGKLMYLGRAGGEVKVYDTATGTLYGNPYFLSAGIESRPADGMPSAQYKLMLLQRLAVRLSWKHVPHVADQRVSSNQ